MTDAQRIAIESADPTISYVARALEFAPDATHALKEELRGYRGPEGHFMCASCVARMLARGCLLPRRSTPVWNSDLAPTPDCIGTPFHIPT